MSFHLVLSFMTFLFEYTFNCSNILHSKSPVSFGNQLWLQQTEMSHYLPVLQKCWFFCFCDYWTFRVWNPWFRVPECSIRSKLNKFCHFSHFTVISNSWNDKILNFFKYTPISFIPLSKYIGDNILPKLTSKFLKCHLNVIFYNIQVGTLE